VPSTNAHGSHDLDPSDDLHGLKILVVEDSLDVGEALKELLILLGASVIGPAASAAEAQNLIAQCLPDVALVDFHLRGGEQSNSLGQRFHGSNHIRQPRRDYRTRCG
jgi:CheY-like chemotaxis protein